MPTLQFRSNPVARQVFDKLSHILPIPSPRPLLLLRQGLTVGPGPGFPTLEGSSKSARELGFGYEPGSSGVGPPLTPHKKMKKRKELNALIGLAGDSRRKKTKQGSSSHRLLRTEPPDSDSASSSEEEEFGAIGNRSRFVK